MKLAGVVGTAVLALTLGIGIPAYAQQDQHEQEAQKDKPTQEKGKRAESAKAVKQDEKQGDRNARQDDKSKPEQRSAQAQHTPEDKSKKDEHARIPDDHFRANFGREHRFHVSEADYRRDRRFQYGGYWFGFAQPWPSNWLYTQDVYVIEINGVYYLCNESYPGVNVILNVTL